MCDWVQCLMGSVRMSFRLNVNFLGVFRVLTGVVPNLNTFGHMCGIFSERHRYYVVTLASYKPMHWILHFFNVGQWFKPTIFNNLNIKNLHPTRLELGALLLCGDTLHLINPCIDFYIFFNATQWFTPIILNNLNLRIYI